MVVDDLDSALAGCSVVELAALAYDWRGWWARPDQIVDDDGLLVSHGTCAGRGFGKTRGHVEAVVEWVMGGKARNVGLMAQNEEETRKVLVDGVSGVLEVSPPWFPARMTGGHIEWPNGATAILYTAEKPGNIRGNEHDLFLITEMCVWPVATREEAMKNVRYSTRLRRAAVFWDTTPKRKHPIIRRLLARSKVDPDRHVVVFGSSDDNRANLSEGFVEAISDEYGGTTTEREERFGEFLDDDDGALWRQSWIDGARRMMPGKLVRRILAIDPAISMRKGTDATGIVELGLGLDGQIFVLDDLGGKLPWEVWTVAAVEGYMARRLDCIVVERNRGGDAIVASLRAVGKERGVRVTVVSADARTGHRSDEILVKEVVGRSSKEVRAEPVASLYERGRVSHVEGVDLTELEDQLTTWEPSPGAVSPNALDALVWGIWELAGLGIEVRDLSKGMAAAPKMQEKLMGSVVWGGAGRSIG
jgi:phage terminase large subunit-like protein